MLSVCLFSVVTLAGASSWGSVTPSTTAWGKVSSGGPATTSVSPGEGGSNIVPGAICGSYTYTVTVQESKCAQQLVCNVVAGGAGAAVGGVAGGAGAAGAITVCTWMYPCGVETKTETRQCPKVYNSSYQCVNSYCG